MTDYYYNNAGAGDYLESDNVTRTWGAGNDSNDGLSRATPFLTGDNLGLNDVNTFNGSGTTYQYTTNGGSAIVLDGFEMLSAQENYSDTSKRVTFEFVGSTATRAFRTNGTTSPSELTIGKGILVQSSGITEDLVWLINNGSGRWTYNFDCKFKFSGSVQNFFGAVNDEFSLQLGENFGLVCSDASVTMLTILKLRPIRDSVVNILGFDLSEWSAGNPNNNIIDAEYPANPGGSFYSVLPHGSCGLTNTNNISIIKVLNPPDKATVEVKKSLNITLENLGNQVDICRFYSPSAQASQSDNCLMYREYGNTSRVEVNAQDGHGFLMGTDVDNDTDGIDGNIINIDLKGGAAVTGSFHGVMHGGSTGYRVDNTARDVGIGTLSKNATAHSINNKMYGVNPTSGEYCFAKGTYAGCTFVGDTCYITNTFGGNVTKVADSTIQDAQNPQFIDIKVVEQGGSIASGAYMNRDGDAVDASEGTRIGMMIDPNLTIDGVFFRRASTDYTVTTAEALGSNPFVNTKTQTLNMIVDPKTVKQKLIGSMIG